MADFEADLTTSASASGAQAPEVLVLIEDEEPEKGSKSPLATAIDPEPELPPTRNAPPGLLTDTLDDTMMDDEDGEAALEQAQVRPITVEFGNVYGREGGHLHTFHTAFCTSRVQSAFRHSSSCFVKLSNTYLVRTAHPCRCLHQTQVGRIHATVVDIPRLRFAAKKIVLVINCDIGVIMLQLQLCERLWGTHSAPAPFPRFLSTMTRLNLLLVPMLNPGHGGNGGPNGGSESRNEPGLRGKPVPTLPGHGDDGGAGRARSAARQSAMPHHQHNRREHRPRL